MLKKFLSQNHDRKFILPSALLIASVSVANVFGQSELRKLVYGDKEKAAKTKKVETKKPVPAAPKNSTATAKKQTPAPSRKPARKPLFVTFTGKQSFVEIWLNDKNIGATDNSLKFTKTILPGEYRLMAKSGKNILLPTRRITVTDDQTDFNLFVETTTPPKPRAEEAVVKKEPVKEKSDMELALEVSAKVKEILQNYAAPATTDAVTPDDWEIVFRAAQLGQLQDYTAVQIEAQRWFASGQIEYAKGEYVNALTAFKKAQEFMPTSALPFYAMGNTYLAGKQYADAVRIYQRALQIDPKLGQAYKKLGDAQRLSSKQKEAVSAYKNAVANGYKTTETRFLLGMTMLENKQIEEALPILEEVAKEDPKSEVFITLGTGYEKIKRDVSAIENYLKATELDPNSAIAYYKLGNVYLNQREYDKAKESLEKSMALDPEGKSLNRTEAQKKVREASSKQNR